MRKLILLFFAIILISQNLLAQKFNKNIVGYYTSWSVYVRDYHVPDIPADKINYINYAFANIDHEAGTIMLGDTYADIDKWYPGDSWDPDSLRGSFHQLQILKAANPHIKTLISVGGWTWSTYFSDIAVGVISGIGEGCRQAKCALIGGETAEMPGFYRDGEYDVAGFIVGWVDRDRIIDGRNIEAGDKIIGLASNGLHTNGYSLARRAFFDLAGLQTADVIDETGERVGEELLKIHRSYLKAVAPLVSDRLIKGIAHITGGGFAGNISRILPDNVNAVINTAAWETPGVFKAIAKIASVSQAEMYRVFNMGIGMTLICSPEVSGQVKEKARLQNVDAYDIGYCEPGEQKVVIK